MSLLISCTSFYAITLVNSLRNSWISPLFFKVRLCKSKARQTAHRKKTERRKKRTREKDERRSGFRRQFKFLLVYITRLLDRSYEGSLNRRFHSTLFTQVGIFVHFAVGCPSCRQLTLLYPTVGSGGSIAPRQEMGSQVRRLVSIKPRNGLKSTRQKIRTRYREAVWDSVGLWSSILACESKLSPPAAFCVFLIHLCPFSPSPIRPIAENTPELPKKKVHFRNCLKKEVIKVKLHRTVRRGPPSVILPWYSVSFSNSFFHSLSMIGAKTPKGFASMDPIA